MNIDKESIVMNICYTELVYGRINKKLKIDLTKEQIEIYIKQILVETSKQYYSKIGKNYYVSNVEKNIRVTINSNTFRIITVDRLSL